jgi:2-phospho-L-lactate transferase/gluconeogenesis factor (CofD/UPF0052 family)
VEASPRSRSPVVNVVLFSGGRGSGALTRQLVTLPNVSLTIAINGYDDGASTGEIRRFLGDSLGPSDFRKNASRIAAALATCPPPLIELLDRRLPDDSTAIEVRALAEQSASVSAAVEERLRRFIAELEHSGRRFNFADCSVGNLVFAGGFLLRARDFNGAVDDYCALLGLPAGLIENVTGGENAWLVGVDDGGHVLATEESIVASGHTGTVRDIFLIGDPLTNEDLTASAAAPGGAAGLLESRTVAVRLNPRLAASLARADLIIYAPGTQHSSLFPSYLTRGLSAAIAANLRAIKLLVTNIQPDAEIRDSNAVQIIDRAVFYLKEKGRFTVPTPCLITHYLVNDPGRHEPDRAYVPLGPIDSIEDPRLVRIGNYEDGVSGRHDASRVLEPFLSALTRETKQTRAAVFLYDGGSPNKVAQTLLEIVRGGIERLPVTLTVFMALSALDPSFLASLPFPVEMLSGGEGEFHQRLRDGSFDYALLFESSGMYRGEDLVAMAGQLATGRLDAVWGSRRLSVRDIEASYQLRYRRTPLLGFISFVGSHVLSLSYLLLFGRYVSDSLSGVRAVRAADAAVIAVDLTHKDVNHHLLSRLLGRKADILEIPVQFFPISPAMVRRTGPLDGLRAIGIMIRHRLRPGS